MSSGKDLKVQTQPVILKDDEKIPLFLIKLWNIVEDPAYYDVIRWDESGYSFHILDPYSFCRNVLPQYFKHNNLNSLIRQLNMYGFRKMTPIERTSLARAESDQDHLEFSHPCFVRDHPELLINIKRKAPTTRQSNEGTVNVASKDLSNVFEELQRLRERQKDMESKMVDLTKENEVVWQEMGVLRSTHLKQQQIVTKLVQFMVALLQPGSKRLVGKRPLLAIDDEFQPKRARGEDTEISLQAIQHHNVGEVLDRLMREYGVPTAMRPHIQNQVAPRRSSNAPIISDVTEELDHLSTKQHSSNNYHPYNDPYHQQQPPQHAFNQTHRTPNIPVNTTMPTQVGISNAVTDTRSTTPNNNRARQQMPPHGPAMPQQAIMQQSHTRPTSYSMPNNGREPVNSPPLNNASVGATNNEPIVTSPEVAPPNFSSNEFADYLNGMDSSIQHCRDAIGEHWDDLDLDSLLSGYEDATSPPNHTSPHFPQTSAAATMLPVTTMNNGFANQHLLNNLTYHPHDQQQH